MTHAALKDLLPCPFCGGDASMKYDSGNEVYGQCWQAGCLKCGVGFAFVGSNSWANATPENLAKDEAAKDSAIAAWNRRAALSAMEGEVGGTKCPLCDAPVKVWPDYDDGRGTSYEYAPPPQQADPHDVMQRTVDKVVSKVMGQREEILQAFVAKYGFQPDEAVQIVGHDGSWRVIRREEMFHPTPSPGPQGGGRSFSEEIGSDGKPTGYLLFDSTPPAHQPGEVGDAQGLRTVLDLLRTDRNGKKWDCIQSASGSMVDVSQFLAPKEAGHDR